MRCSAVIVGEADLSVLTIAMNSSRLAIMSVPPSFFLLFYISILMLVLTTSRPSNRLVLPWVATYSTFKFRSSDCACATSSSSSVGRSITEKTS